MKNSNQTTKRFFPSSRWFLLVLSILIPLILLSVNMVSAKPMLQQGFEVIGQVVEPDGTTPSVGLHNVCLTHIHPNSGEADWWHCEDSNADGSFNIIMPDNFPFGDFFIKADSPDGSPFFRSVPAGPYELQPNTSSPADAGDLRLTHASFIGTVSDPSGNLITHPDGGGILVFRDDGTHWKQVAEGTYGPDGQYAIGGIPDGDSFLQAGPPPNTPLQWSEPIPIHVDPGTQYDPTAAQTYDLHLTGADLIVSVEDPNYTPLTATVHVWDEYGMYDEWHQSFPGDPARFGGLMDGETYWVESWPDPENIPAFANSSVDEVIFDVAQAPFNFSQQLRGPDISGQVLTPEGAPLPPLFDPTTLDPIPNEVHIGVWDLNSPFKKDTFTNGVGEYSLAVPPGEYHLVAFPKGPLAEMYTQSLPPDSPLSGGTVNLPFDPKLTYPSVAGHILDDEGNPIPNCVNVWLRDLWTDQVAAEFWTCGGFFQLGGVPAGEYTLEIDSLPNILLFAPEPIWLNIMDGTQYDPTATQWFDIIMVREEASAFGRLHFPAGQNGIDAPVTDGVDAVLFLNELPDPTDPNWEPPYLGSVPVYDGQYFFTNLPAGDYMVAFHIWDGNLNLHWNPPQPFTFTLAMDGDVADLGTRYLQTFASPKRVIGSVVDQNNNPVNNAIVFAVEEYGNGFAADHTAPDGKYGLFLSGGDWKMGVKSPENTEVNWEFDPLDEEWVWFESDNMVVTKTINFVVHRFDLGERFELTGVITRADGNPIISGMVGVKLCNDVGECFNKHVRDDGNFTLLAPPDFYDFRVWVNPDSNLILPDPNNFSVLLDRDIDLVVEFGHPLVLNSRDSNDVGKVMGRVVVSTTQGLQGLPNVAIVAETWRDDWVDWAETETITNGTFTLHLSPGYWHGGPHLTPEQKKLYFVLPPNRREGFVASGEVITGQNFILIPRDASILGKVVNLETSQVVTDADVFVFAEICNQNEHCERVANTLANEGRFQLSVVGGHNYKLGVSVPEGGYMLDSPVDVFVAANGVATATIKLIKAGTRIHGGVINGATGDPVLVDTLVYGYDSAGNYFVEDFVRADQDPHEYNLWVPTPATGSAPVTWTLKVGVRPETGFIPDPAHPAYKVVIQPGATEVFNDVHVNQLNTFVTGTVKLGAGPAAHAWVIVEGMEDTNSEGLFFEGQANEVGRFKIPVLPGEYEVTAFVPPNEVGDYFPPEPISWSSEANNPVILIFRHRTGSLALDIHGTLEVRDASNSVVNLPGNTAIDVFAWAVNGGHVHVTGTVESGYSLPIMDNTTWYVWAVYEDEINGVFYESDEFAVEVAGGAEIQNLVLNAGEFSLPDPICETFSPSSFARISLPGRPNLPELAPPLIEIQAGTMPVDSSVSEVEVCVRPMLGVPGGQHLVGMAYALEARADGTLIEDDFNKSVRFIFYYNTADIANLDPDNLDNQLKPKFYSTTRSDWVELDDLFIDPEDGFVTGKVDHFTNFGAFASQPIETTTTTYSLYLPIVLK